jgi:hypothetical protein
MVIALSPALVKRFVFIVMITIRFAREIGHRVATLTGGALEIRLFALIQEWVGLSG